MSGQRAERPLDTRSVSPFLQLRLRSLPEFLGLRALQSRTGVEASDGTKQNGRRDVVFPAIGDTKPSKIGGD